MDRTANNNVSSNYWFGIEIILPVHQDRYQILTKILTHRPGDVNCKALESTTFCNEFGNACFKVLPLCICGQAGNVGKLWHRAHHLLHILPILCLQVPDLIGCKKKNQKVLLVLE